MEKEQKEINDKCELLHIPHIFDDENNLTPFGCNVLVGIGIALANHAFNIIYTIMEKE